MLGVQADPERQGAIYTLVWLTQVGQAVRYNSFGSLRGFRLDDAGRHGAVRVAAEGAAPSDGFTEYPSVGGNRPRWGDYSASVVAGDTVYIANEYIGHSCDTETFFGDTTCGQIGRAHV